MKISDPFDQNANKFRSSQLWKSLNEDLFNYTNELDLSDFRSSEKQINARLASWAPYDATQRYYKNILFNLATSMPEKFFYYYQKLGNSNLGLPINVKVNNMEINLDYLFSIQEIIFLESILPFSDRIVEIGAGFGRTVHAILNNFNSVKSYTIIDLEPMLKLSSRYLKEVLSSSDYSKIVFIKAKDAEKVAKIDLAINIDSIAEMEPEVCLNYLNLINTHARYFYIRNPICKYTPESIGIKNIPQIRFDTVANLGLCRKVIDIFDEESLSLYRKEYEKIYLPGPLWTLFKSEVSYPWQYYQHALYKK